MFRPAAAADKIWETGKGGRTGLAEEGATGRGGRGAAVAAAKRSRSRGRLLITPMFF